MRQSRCRGKIKYMEFYQEDHKRIAEWAANCAERALPYFTEMYPDDPRPEEAIAALRAWIGDVLPVNKVRTTVFGAHGAARLAPSRSAAQFAARAAASAASVAYAIDGARAAADYAAQAVLSAEGEETEHAERAQQHQELPKRLHPLAFPAEFAHEEI